MAFYYTGEQHDTPSYADAQRDYEPIAEASKVAGDAVLHEDIAGLAKAINMSYEAQLKEGMEDVSEFIIHNSKSPCLAKASAKADWLGNAAAAGEGMSFASLKIKNLAMLVYSRILTHAR